MSFFWYTKRAIFRQEVFKRWYIDGKPRMTIDKLIALLEKGQIKEESNNEDKTELKENK